MRTPLLALALVAALAGCGGASVSTAPTTTPAVARKPAPAPAPAPLGEHKLARSAVHDAVSQGLGSFLQHVEMVDQPVMASGKFKGFRIASLRDAPFWQGVDLQPGDVVIAVNGFPIEHPEQAQTAFDSLEVSSELRVSYERDGKPRELVYAIVDGL